MDVNAEARRILAVSISKLYASRSQRGGLRLHRSLLVSLVMKSARDIYHSTAALMEKAAEAAPSTEQAMEAMDTAEKPESPPESPRESPRESPPESPRESPLELPDRSAEDKENQSPAEKKRPRKRPGKLSAVPDFLPEKRARLEPGEERHDAAQSHPQSHAQSHPQSHAQSHPQSHAQCRSALVLAENALPLNRVIPAF